MTIKAEPTEAPEWMKVRLEIERWINANAYEWRQRGVEAGAFQRRYNVQSIRASEDWGVAVGHFGSLRDYDPNVEREGVSKLIIDKQMSFEHARVLILTAVDGVAG